MKKIKTLSKNRTTKKTFAFKTISILLAVFLGIAIIVLHNAYTNSTEMKSQLKQNLADVARQNAAIVDSRIYQQYELLTALAAELQDVTPETIDAKLDHFKIFIDDFNLKRFAFCFPDGMTYSTDGEPTDLSYRHFYQQGMSGKCSITGILYDALQAGNKPVNIMTIPVFDGENNVTGVFGLAYDTAEFNKSLQIDCFDGQGYSCIINENGEILATTTENNDFELSNNIIDDILKSDKRNESEIKHLQEQLSQKEEVNGTLYLSEKSYYYCIPVNLMDGSVTWYICTLIPSQVLNQRISPILNNQLITSFLVIFLVLIGAFFIVMYIKQQHRQMINFAYEDPVTSGTNYTKFCLDMKNQAGTKGYLIVMDIDNFNNISVVASEEASDIMIKETWHIIDHSLKKEELAAHVRDDMFLLFLQEPSDDMLLKRMSDISAKITKKADDFKVYGIQARYGVCLMSGSDTLESAYSKVKLAREYAVVKLGLNYAFYNEVNRVKMQHEKHLEARFPLALQNNEFEVWYQPKYSAADCTIVGSEALVRWRNPNGDMISPGEFIPLFERNGMIVELDEYMFCTVCKQQKKWLDEGKKVYPVSINISRASLYRIDVEERYRKIMQTYEIEPQYIQLEVTETVMEKKTDICGLLNNFRNIGIKILMDDFGTGYSSLATLSSQCFDTLKLDKTLIDHIGNKDGETMLYHIVRMGQQMGLHITAEGVEKHAQLEFLQHLNCDDIQGYYFSKPIPMNEYEDLIKEG